MFLTHYKSDTCKRRKIRWKKPQLVKQQPQKRVHVSSCLDQIKTTRLITASWLHHAGKKMESKDIPKNTHWPNQKSLLQQPAKKRVIDCNRMDHSTGQLLQMHLERNKQWTTSVSSLQATGRLLTIHAAEAIVWLEDLFLTWLLFNKIRTVTVKAVSQSEFIPQGRNRILTYY